MRRKVLVPLDGSDFRRQVLFHLQHLLVPDHYELVLLYIRLPSDVAIVFPVAPTMEAPVSYYGNTFAVLGGEGPDSPQVDFPDALLEAAQQDVQDLEKAGYAVSVAYRSGPFADEVIAFAKRENIDMVAMATHARTGASRFLFGSNADQLLRRLFVPVLLVHTPPQSSSPEQSVGVELAERLSQEERVRMVVATDGSAYTSVTTAFAGELARTLGAEATLLAIAHTRDDLSHASHMIEVAREGLGDVGPGLRCIPLVGHTADLVLRHIQENPTDLLVIGTFRDHGTTSPFAVGVTAQRLIQSSPVSVLVAKGHQPAIQKVLVSVALHDHDVVDSAIAFARVIDADFRLLHVVPDDAVSAAEGPDGVHIPLDTILRQRTPLAGYLRALQEQLADWGYGGERIIIRCGTVGNAILSESREGHYDLIVLGSHAGPAHFNISLGNYITRNAARSVLIVKAPHG